jgi:REP element-mobilizing transposase RayT
MQVMSTAPTTTRPSSRKPRRAKRPPRGEQLPLPLDSRRRGGFRRGAGRKPRGERAGVPHRPRGPVTRHTPVHVTLKVVPGLPNLRHPAVFPELRTAIYRGANRIGLRVIHFCVLRNHIHLLVEAGDARPLGRGMQGLCIRLARQLNRACGRRGTVFADRYHSHVLRTPSETRTALNYLLKNQRRHVAARGQVHGRWWVDHCSSGHRFTGWEGIEVELPEDDLPIGRPRSWLLSRGWMRGCGARGAGEERRLSVDQVPGPRRR